MDIPKEIHTAGYTAWALHGQYSHEGRPPGLLVKLPCAPNWMDRDHWATLVPDYDDLTRRAWIVHDRLEDAWAAFTGAAPDIDPFDVGRSDAPHPMIEPNAEAVRLAVIDNGYPGANGAHHSIWGYAFHLANPDPRASYAVPCAALLTVPDGYAVTLTGSHLRTLGRSIDTLMAPQMLAGRFGGGIMLRDWAKGRPA